MKNHISVRCVKGFKSSGALKSHLNFHSCEKKYKCEICDESFSQSNGLKKHLKIHHASSNTLGNESCLDLIKCEMCNKQFSNTEKLQLHEKSHFVAIPYTCIICGNIVKYKCSLDTHLKIKNGVISFKCEACKLFSPS